MSAGRGWTLVATIVGTSVVFLDATVVNIALPAIGRDLPSTFFGVLEGQTYVYTGYFLTLSALLILAGALSDFHGRRRVFLIGLAGFGVTSVFCGLAPTIELLVFFRLLQGATGALLVPGSLAILTAAYSGEERGRAFGLWAGASAAVAIVGPYVGGLLVDLLSWRVVFLANVPIVAVAAWATVAGVVESRDESASGRFDWLGALVMAVALGGLSFGVIYGQQREWQAPLAWIALAIGAAATVAFPFLMARSHHPLVPLELFRSRNFSTTNLSTLLIYGALYVFALYIPLFTQGTLGYSAAASGLALVPAFLFLAVFSTITGSLAVRYGPRAFMAVGPLLMAAGVLWVARIPPDSPPLRLDLGGGVEGLLVAGVGLALFRIALDRGNPLRWLILVGGSVLAAAGVGLALAGTGTEGYARDLLPGQIIYGVGVTLMVTPLTTALMASVPLARAGLGSAINNAISRVGPQLAGAVIFVAVTASYYATLVRLAPALDITSPGVRATFPPLNQPVGPVAPDLVAAARTASTDAFQLAMLIVAGLLFAGAAVNAIGIRDPGREVRPAAVAPAGGVLSPRGEEDA